MQVDTSGRSSVARRRFYAIAARIAVSALLAMILMGLAAGCGGGRSAKEAVATAGPGSSGVGPGAGVDSAPGPCATGQLEVTVGPSSGAAGSRYFDLTFTNISSRSCSLYGYSGVSFRKSAQGQQVGAAAQRRPGVVQPVTLAPESRAYEMLQVVNAENYPSPACGLTPVTGLQVFPPDQRSAAWVPVTLQGCNSPSEDLISIWPVTSTPG